MVTGNRTAAPRRTAHVNRNTTRTDRAARARASAVVYGRIACQTGPCCDDLRGVFCEAWFCWPLENEYPWCGVGRRALSQITIRDINLWLLPDCVHLWLWLCGVCPSQSHLCGEPLSFCSAQFLAQYLKCVAHPWLTPRLTPRLSPRLSNGIRLYASGSRSAD